MRRADPTNTLTKEQARVAEQIARAALIDVGLDPSLLEAYELDEDDYDIRCRDLTGDERVYRAGTLGVAAAQPNYTIFCVSHWRALASKEDCQMLPAGEVVRLGFPSSCEEVPE